jgi:transcriptional regulator with XRE-family HTH domain
MGTSQRLFDRATELAKAALARLGRELRDARRDRGLSVAAAARAAGISRSQLSRIERGESARVPLLTLHRCAAVVGLDLSSRLYPGPGPLRDEAHALLLADLKSNLHRELRWATEVPLPIAGDLRAWDGFVSGTGWRYGVEAETAPRDAQALNRRLQLKLRDGGVDGLLLILRDSQANRRFVREAAVELGPSFPQSGQRALELLRAGVNPGGSAIIMIPRMIPRPIPGRIPRRIPGRIPRRISGSHRSSRPTRQRQRLGP